MINLQPKLRLYFRVLIMSLSLIVFQSPSFAQESSVLANGKWVKMSFATAGVYKIDRSVLTDMGFDPVQIDPANLAIYGNGGGMLSQSNAVERVQDLHENAIYVHGGLDGIFNSEDYILFYVDAVSARSFDDKDQTFSFEKNLYTDQVSYFITVKNTAGKRIASNPNLGTGFPLIETYNKLIWHEEDLFNILGSGREWYGERFDSQNEKTFDLSLDGLAATGTIGIYTKAMAQSFLSSSMTVELDGNQIGQLNFNSIANARYTRKGNDKNRTWSVPAAGRSSLSNLKFTFDRNGSTSALAYLDEFILDVPAQLQLSNEQTPFRSVQSLENGISTYQISNTTAESMIWNISNPLDPSLQESDFSTGLNSFGDFSDRLKEYVVFNPSEISLVTSFEPLENQDLHGMSSPDFIIISHQDFLSQAQRLADFRQSNDGLETTVVDLTSIYNEFSSGNQDISAIRDFIRYMYNQSGKLKYVLFFGRGSYDYKSRIDQNTNFTPTYEARNSIDPLNSFSSDDFFGFLDEDEGEWVESAIGDHILDIGIGRIPATSPEDAEIAIDKIINYQTSSQTLGDWRSRLLFVADDGDNNIHQRDADQLATLVDTTYDDFNVHKLYLDAFEQERQPTGEFSPSAQQSLLNSIEQGVLVLNFTGHGAETGWMQERVLTLELIDEMSNIDNLPLLVTATCEFGRNDDPSIISGAEKMLFKDDGGAIALITTARPVFSSTNYDLNLALYGSILEQENGNYARLGDIIKFTKNNSLNGSLNRNFLLLGDPSMRLAYPSKDISIQSINGLNVDPLEIDTIKALQRVQISGQIEQDGVKDGSFNGTLNFELLDKRQKIQTKGTESRVFEFEERNSALFKGTASISHGNFSLQFVVPLNIDYNWGAGKMVMYAINENGTQDALGSNVDFILGGTADLEAPDNSPPEILAYLNDTLSNGPFFIKSNATLLVKIVDENGINISQAGIGQEITAVLNDSVQFNLNPFFTTIKDDFTIGWVDFPLRNLHSGPNRLTIKAWDNYNNSQTSTLEFIVSDDNSTLITDITNFPNPFITSTTFSIAHNSAGERVELTVEIFNNRGEKITSLYQTASSANSVQEILWNGTNFDGSKLSNGLYIYNVILRSESSGETYSKRQKLIISN